MKSKTRELAKPARIPKNRKPGTLHSFFALKFHEGDEDKTKVEAIEKALNEAGVTITLMARDVEKWGKADIPEGKTLMTDYAFPAMRECDCNIIEFSEKGVGLGINAGYCYAIGKPIFVIAKTGSDISTTIGNLATKVIFYDTPEDLVEPFKEIVKEFSSPKRRVSPELREYIEKNIFPEYQKNEPAHSLTHIKNVIKRSFKFAGTVPDANYDIVFTVAAYHDIGHHIDAKWHEIVSAEIMQKDKNLEQFFSRSELKTIKEAIEDHRASSDHEPRSIYGKIVSTADRDNSVEASLFRSYDYGKRQHPDYSDEELFNRAHKHLSEKFGEKGYAKFFFEDEEYENFLSELRKLLADKDLFIKTQKDYIKNLTKKQEQK